MNLFIVKFKKLSSKWYNVQSDSVIDIYISHIYIYIYIYIYNHDRRYKYDSQLSKCLCNKNCYEFRILIKYDAYYDWMENRTYWSFEEY